MTSWQRALDGTVAFRGRASSNNRRRRGNGSLENARLVQSFCLASHAQGGIPRRCVKTLLRAVAFVYPTAAAISFSELPLRNMV